MTKQTKTTLTVDDFVKYYRENPEALRVFIEEANKIADAYIELVDERESQEGAYNDAQ